MEKPFKTFFKSRSTSSVKRMSVNIEKLKLFESGDDADLNIKCGNRTYHVHLPVLASECRKFAEYSKKLAGATEIEFTILSDEPDVVEEFLKIVYRPAGALEEQPALGSVKLERETKLFMLGEHYGADRVRSQAANNVRAGLHCTYATDDFLAAVRELWRHPEFQPAESAVLRTLFVRELRKRWLELAERRDGFMELVGGCGGLANNLQQFACEAHYDDDGLLFGPDFACQYCGMDLAWPGGEKKCPACLHMASLGNSQSPWFRNIPITEHQ